MSWRMSDLAIPTHSEQHCVMALICSISKRAISGNYIPAFLKEQSVEITLPVLQIPLFPTIFLSSNPGHPVFFNYANITKAPSSLKVFMLTPFVLFHWAFFLQSPEANFSTKGRLVEDNGSYIFELFHYTHQVNMQSIGRDTSCSMQTRASFDTVVM